MPAVLVTQPTVTQNSPFFRSSGLNHSQYSFLTTHGGGLAQTEPTWVPGSVPRWFTCSKTVTNPVINRVRRMSNYVDQNQHVTGTTVIKCCLSTTDDECDQQIETVTLY